MSDYGRDISCFPDLDGTFAIQGTERTLIEALAKRLSTPRGALEFHPDYGLDVREFLSRRMTERSLAEIQSAIERELEQDERVASATVTAAYTISTRELALSCSVETADGSFDFTVTVSQLNPSLQVS